MIYHSSTHASSHRVLISHAGAGHIQQPQQDSKKSRFSLNFLRASLLSPKGGSVSKGSSIFSSAAERKVSAQPTPASKAISPSPSSSPSRQDSVDPSTASAQHWSPLGHGASALNISVPAEQADEASSIRHSQDTFTSAEPRSPLQALSSNSPTKLRHHSKQTAGDDVGSRSQRTSLQAASPAAEQPSHGIHYADIDDAAAPTIILSAVSLDQRSPLPSNALVAYSSDEDDWHNAEDGTESRLQLYRHWQSSHVPCHLCFELFSCGHC